MKNEKDKWDIGEFVSYTLTDDASGDCFAITITGPQKYRNLLVAKLDAIRITEGDLQEWVDKKDK